MRAIKYKIAEINLLYEFPNKFADDFLSDYVCDFEDPADIFIKIVEKKAIKYLSEDETPFYNKELNWYNADFKTYCNGRFKRVGSKGYVIEKVGISSEDILVRMLVNSDWTYAEIQVLKDFEVVSWFIEYLFLEIVFRNRIIHHTGMVIHGSAILFNNRSILFSAPSGTGKSTQARLWQDIKGAGCINDDHPVVKIIDKNPIVFGSPWAGSDFININKSAPLAAVVILEQAKVNRIIKLSSIDAIQNFLPRCFLPYHNKEHMDKAMEIYKAITNFVPIYKFYCLPDKSAVEFLSETLSNELKL